MITRLSRCRGVLDVEVTAVCRRPARRRRRRRATLVAYRSTVSNAAWLAAVAVEGRLRCSATPSLTSGLAELGRCPSMPAMACGDLVGRVGVGRPPGPGWPRRPGSARPGPPGRRPTSASLVNVSSVVRPSASSPTGRAHARPARRGDRSRPRAAARAIRRPTCAQRPVAVGSAEPNAGRIGQNIQRPKMTSSAGSSVIIASSPTTTPIAATGPRPGWSSSRRASGRACRSRRWRRWR